VIEGNAVLLQRTSDASLLDGAGNEKTRKERRGPVPGPKAGIKTVNQEGREGMSI